MSWHRKLYPCSSLERLSAKLEPGKRKNLASEQMDKELSQKKSVRSSAWAG